MHAALNDNDMNCLLCKSHKTGQENAIVIFEGYIESNAPPKKSTFLINNLLKCIRLYFNLIHCSNIFFHENKI